MKTFINVSKKSAPAEIRTAKIFSTDEVYRIPHKIERKKDGIITLSFANLSGIPFVVILKALGLVTDKEILEAIGLSSLDEDIYLNLYDFIEINTAKEAQEFISKTLRLNLSRDYR